MRVCDCFLCVMSDFDPASGIFIIKTGDGLPFTFFPKQGLSRIIYAH